ncbi:hypothetical protein BC938DRAFT_477353 [Jimgerdemannia flammicorona]|uniref:Uncharacterized protein n=1 Tax=Jimgerdemannia flammicorona TaxID=994334 RepID=A0A433QPH2_9FUNG|nr:hypothetical protein BC938DRAFT_477353 [Jimgerdemannia flammicorona]
MKAMKTFWRLQSLSVYKTLKPILAPTSSLIEVEYDEDVLANLAVDQFPKSQQKTVNDNPSLPQGGSRGKGRRRAAKGGSRRKGRCLKKRALNVGGKGERVVGEREVGEREVGKREVGEHVVSELEVGDRAIGERAISERGVIGERRVGEGEADERVVG